MKATRAAVRQAKTLEELSEQAEIMQAQLNRIEQKVDRLLRAASRSKNGKADSTAPEGDAS